MGIEAENIAAVEAGPGAEVAGVPEPGGQAGVMTALAGLPCRTLLTEAALAGALRVSDRTIRRMVLRGELPPGMRLGGKKVWLAGRVLDHFTARAERLAREADKENSRLKKLFP